MRLGPLTVFEKNKCSPPFHTFKDGFVVQTGCLDPVMKFAFFLPFGPKVRLSGRSSLETSTATSLQPFAEAADKEVVALTKIGCLSLSEW